jgi:hypothetical protein
MLGSFDRDNEYVDPVAELPGQLNNNEFPHPPPKKTLYYAVSYEKLCYFT